MPPRFVPFDAPSTFRKMAAAAWRRPDQPLIFGSTDLDATAALAHLDQERARTGLKITMTHLVARATALALGRHPELNAKVRWWGKLERRSRVDLFLQVAADGGRDLSGARIDDADHKGVEQIARELRDKADAIRRGKDPSLQKSRGLLGALPWWAAGAAMRLSDTLTNELHLDLPRQGMPLDPFGSAMITSVGMFGIDTGFAPFFPLARCPMLLLVTEVKRRPWVVGDEVVPRPVLRLCATFDHRIIDGYHAGLLSRDVGALLESPADLG